MLFWLCLTCQSTTASEQLQGSPLCCASIYALQRSANISIKHPPSHITLSQYCPRCCVIACCMKKAMGLELDGSGFGLGSRSQRYAAVVEDGVVSWVQGGRRVGWGLGLWVLSLIIQLPSCPTTASTHDHYQLHQSQPTHCMITIASQLPCRSPSWRWRQAPD